MDAALLEQIRDYLNKFDRFAKSNNMQITVIREDYAEAEFLAGENHLNGLHIVQGGALFTLADFAFAGAVNSHGVKAIGMGSSVSFVHPGKGSRFKAVATTVSRGKRTCVVNVDVFDEQNTLLLHSTMTGFILGTPFFE